jgi:hypothetical protein
MPVERSTAEPTDAARFDRQHLPPATFEFVVIADTHHIVDPFMYRAEGDSVNPTIVRDWTARGDTALAMARGLGPLLTFHLGDLQQEYPGHASFDVGRQAAVHQLQDAGFPMQVVAGNMDIGDKPDPTMPAGRVRPEWLAVWDEDFGPSFRSLDEGGLHFVVLNSQLLDSELPQRDEQRAWLEADLAAHAGERIVLFFHVPPFLVDEDEPGLGSYDVLGDRDRSWLLDLMRRYRVEAVFCGHTHFRFLNRADDSRIHIAPSTTTTRPGFYEAISVAPPERGWADTAKLGFLLVRAVEGRLAVHLIRSAGRTTLPTDGRRIVLTATSQELPGSPLGAYLRLPLAAQSDGAIVYPYHVRHRVRDDHPLLACLELGVRHVRVPIRDLDIPLQRERLGVLRDEGVSVTATLISDGRSPLAVDVGDGADAIEVQTAGSVLPRPTEIVAIGRLRTSVEVSLAPIVTDPSAGTVHGRSRTGYRIDELAELEADLDRQGLSVDHAVCQVDDHAGTPWESILALGRIERTRIRGLDAIVSVSSDDRDAHLPLAEAVMAAATVPMIRLFVDPLQRLDREASITGGLLDRLSNPEPVFHVVRVLNSILFNDASPGAWELAPGPVVAAGIRAVSDGRVEHWLIDGDDPGPVIQMLAHSGLARGFGWTDLAAGESCLDMSADRIAALVEQQSGRVSLLTMSTAHGARPLAAR